VARSGATVAVLRQRGHADVSLAPGSDVTVVGWPTLGYKVGVSADGVLSVSEARDPGSVLASAKLARN
jgi:hypothetical protein